MVLVMPEGDSSYYTNSFEHPQDRYEDYIMKDLIHDVESRFPVASGRQSRAYSRVYSTTFNDRNSRGDPTRSLPLHAR